MKTTMRYYYKTIRITKIKKNLSILSAYKDVGQVKFLYITGRNEKWYSH